VGINQENGEMFYRYQQVLCIDAESGRDGYIWIPGEEIITGNTYTIHSTFAHPVSGIPMVRLSEVRRSQRCIDMWNHDGYGAYRFRPLTETKSSVSFTAGADPSTKKYDNRRRRKVKA
jgi:hypothetical protein